MSAWQPIETAPENERVLVLRGRWVEVGMFSTTYDEWVPLANPTHWMPLPEPITGQQVSVQPTNDDD